MSARLLPFRWGTTVTVEGAVLKYLSITVIGTEVGQPKERGNMKLMTYVFEVAGLPEKRKYTWLANKELVRGFSFDMSWAGVLLRTQVDIIYCAAHAAYTYILQQFRFQVWLVAWSFPDSWTKSICSDGASIVTRGYWLLRSKIIRPNLFLDCE